MGGQGRGREGREDVQAQMTSSRAINQSEFFFTAN